MVSLKLVIHATERFYGYLERYFILIFLSLFCLFCQWDLLLRDYNEAKDLIEDIKDICDDFEGLCQRNLAANTGLWHTDCKIRIKIEHFSLFFTLTFLLLVLSEPMLKYSWIFAILAFQITYSGVFLTIIVSLWFMLERTLTLDFNVCFAVKLWFGPL